MTRTSPSTNRPDTRPSAVIVDIDGTIAKHVNDDGTLRRGHYEYSRVHEDLPNPPVIAVVRALHQAGHQVVFCSGRASIDDDLTDVRAATRGWLSRHLPELAEEQLLMRAAGDRRPDDLIKLELFKGQIEPYYDVVCALDDRDRVVAMWRDLGITCLQVAPGDF